jgi:hypothetical protein
MKQFEKFTPPSADPSTHRTFPRIIIDGNDEFALIIIDEKD